MKLSILVLAVASFVATAKCDWTKCGVNVVLTDTFYRRSGLAQGANATRREYSAAEVLPWVVSYGKRNEEAADRWQHVCGGTVIGPDLVLTAQHCVREIGQNGLIRAGDSDIKKVDDDDFVQVVKVVEATPHPLRDSSSESAFYDVAVLRVDPPFAFTNTVRHICLPDKARDEVEADRREGEGVTVAGFGETEKGNSSTVGELRNTLVTIRPEDFCRKIYSTAKDKLETYEGDDKKEDEIKIDQIKKVKNENVEESSQRDDETFDPESKDDSIRRYKRERPKKAKPTPEEIQSRISVASKLVPDTFNSSIMCIGSELGGIGACKGDDGGPGFIFDTGDELNSEKYVQIAVFSGAVGCGVASYPDIYVRLEEPATLEWIRQFAPAPKE